MNVFWGIDPGKVGGLAAIRDDGTVLRAAAWIEGDDEAALYESLDAAARIARPTRVALEKVGAMPGQGVSSTFKFGMSFGMLRGILCVLDCPYELVSPRTWTTAVLVGVSDKSDKAEHCRFARRLFPGANLRRNERCTTDSDAIADALLLAEFARRRFAGEEG